MILHSCTRQVVCIGVPRKCQCTLVFWLESSVPRASSASQEIVPFLSFRLQLLLIKKQTSCSCCSVLFKCRTFFLQLQETFIRKFHSASNFSVLYRIQRQGQCNGLFARGEPGFSPPPSSKKKESTRQHRAVCWTVGKCLKTNPQFLFGVCFQSILDLGVGPSTVQNLGLGPWDLSPLGWVCWTGSVLSVVALCCRFCCCCCCMLCLCLHAAPLCHGLRGRGAHPAPRHVPGAEPAVPHGAARSRRPLHVPPRRRRRRRRRPARRRRHRQQRRRQRQPLHGAATNLSFLFDKCSFSLCTCLRILPDLGSWPRRRPLCPHCRVEEFLSRSLSFLDRKKVWFVWGQVWFCFVA